VYRRLASVLLLRDYVIGQRGERVFGGGLRENGGVITGRCLGLRYVSGGVVLGERRERGVPFHTDLAKRVRVGSIVDATETLD
jgi:hypothetical protein